MQAAEEFRATGLQMPCQTGGCTGSCSTGRLATYKMWPGSIFGSIAAYTAGSSAIVKRTSEGYGEVFRPAVPPTRFFGTEAAPERAAVAEASPARCACACACVSCVCACACAEDAPSLSPVNLFQSVPRRHRRMKEEAICCMSAVRVSHRYANPRLIISTSLFPSPIAAISSRQSEPLPAMRACPLLTGIHDLQRSRPRACELSQRQNAAKSTAS